MLNKEKQQMLIFENFRLINQLIAAALDQGMQSKVKESKECKCNE